MNEQNELLTAAMQIILHAGNARNGYEPSLLFAHAQDTLMTIKSELHLSRQLIDVLKIIKNNK